MRYILADDSTKVYLTMSKYSDWFWANRKKFTVAELKDFVLNKPSIEHMASDQMFYQYGEDKEVLEWLIQNAYISVFKNSVATKLYKDIPDYPGKWQFILREASDTSITDTIVGDLYEPLRDGKINDLFDLFLIYYTSYFNYRGEIAGNQIIQNIWSDPDKLNQDCQFVKYLIAIATETKEKAKRSKENTFNRLDYSINLLTEQVVKQIRYEKIEDWIPTSMLIDFYRFYPDTNFFINLSKRDLTNKQIDDLSSCLLKSDTTRLSILESKRK